MAWQFRGGPDRAETISLACYREQDSRIFPKARCRGRAPEDPLASPMESGCGRWPTGKDKSWVEGYEGPGEGPEVERDPTPESPAPGTPHFAPAQDLRPGVRRGKCRALAPEGRGAPSPRSPGHAECWALDLPQDSQPGGARRGPPSMRHPLEGQEGGGVQATAGKPQGLGVSLPIWCREGCLDDCDPSPAMPLQGAGVEGGGDLGNSHVGNLGVGLPEQKGVRKLGQGSASWCNASPEGPPSAQWGTPGALWGLRAAWDLGGDRMEGWPCPS